MFNKKPFVLLVLLSSAFIFNACGNKEKAENKEQTIKEYKVLTLKAKSTILFSDYPATIEGQQDIEIRPKIDGYLSKILVDEGAHVRKGQLLFKISAPQYEQEVRTARANILIAEANVNTAQMEVNKVAPLVEKNIISKYELESAQFALQSKQALLAQAKATVANANINLDYTSIYSPVTGVVGAIPYKIGSLITGNTAMPLTTVSNIGNIYAYFSINEKVGLKFLENNTGGSMQQQLSSLLPVDLLLSDGNKYNHKGKIEAIVGSINTQTGSISVRAVFPNPQSIVRSGSSGKVRIFTNVADALVIPQKATFEIQGKKLVYVVDDKGVVKSVEIEVMDSGNGDFYVVNKGLANGDKVVIEGVATLKEGSIIKPVEIDADTLNLTNQID